MKKIAEQTDFEFGYVFPFINYINIILYSIIILASSWLFFVHPHEYTPSYSKFEAIVTYITIVPFLIIKTISLLATYYNSLKYKPIIIDFESITFPFQIDDQYFKWKFQDITYVRIDFEKSSIWARHFIEVSKNSRSIKLYKSWMNPTDYEKLQDLLKLQNIKIEEPI